MDELTAFVRARLDEDEAAANEAASRPLGATWDDGTRHTAVARHIARHDPARELREVAAKRAVLEWYADSVDASRFFQEKLGTGKGMAIAAESYLNVIQAMAVAWSDHPDYRTDWRPPHAEALAALPARR